jgi:hypothetical protein
VWSDSREKIRLMVEWWLARQWPEVKRPLPWDQPNVDDWVRRVCCMVRKYRPHDHFAPEADELAVELVRKVKRPATVKRIVDAIEQAFETHRERQ